MASRFLASSRRLQTGRNDQIPLGRRRDDVNICWTLSHEARTGIERKESVGIWSRVVANFIRAGVFAELHGPDDSAGHLGLQLGRRWLLIQCGEQIGSMQIVDAAALRRRRLVRNER